MKGRTNSKTGGGVPDRGAVIRVLAVTGSEISFYQSGNRLKTIKANQSIQDGVKTGFSNYFYSVPSGRSGSMTVECRLENIRTYKTVTVTDEQEYDCVIGPGLYQDGLVNTELTGGIVQDFTISQFNGYGMTKDQADLNSDHILLDMTVYSGSTSFRYKEVNTDSKIDLTPFSTLTVHYEVIAKIYAVTFQVYGTKSKTNVNNDYGPAYAAISMKEPGEYTATIDISNVTGEYYILAYSHFGAASDIRGSCKITEILLEV